MKGLRWKPTIHTHAFDSAKANMQFDEQLLLTLKENERVVRVYVWQSPGLTFSFKQTCPKEMAIIDHAIRITGGGIVCHSPGDVVFSIAGHANDAAVPKSPRKKLDMVSNQLKQSLMDANVALDDAPLPFEKDLAFCQSYPTPFELSINGKKICGLTIRQFKTNWLIQGILHAQPTHPVFYPWIPDAQHLDLQLDSAHIQQTLIQALKLSII